MLTIGWARADITPHAGIEMAGFGKRIQPSLGVSDPLYATALVASDDKTALAVIDCDLLGVGAAFMTDVRGKIESLAGIPGRNVSVVCTHTHYGPSLHRDVAGSPPQPTYEETYRELLSFQLAGLVYEAKTTMQPARIRIGMGQSDIGVNRRERTADGRIVFGVNPDGAVDRAVGVCRIETAAGKPLATLVNFTCHANGQDAQIRMISADFVGCMRRVVEDATGVPCLFWQGAAGNVSIVSAETKYSAACSSGKRLGEEVARVWETAKPIKADCVRTVSRVLDLPPYRGLSREHAREQVEESERDLEATRKNPRSTPGLIEWHERNLKRLTKLHDSWTDPSLLPPPVKAELVVGRIGELAWAFVPGELFNEIGSEIKKRSPLKHTFLAAYANDYIGYLPTLQAFHEGGYEVNQGCHVAPEAMPMMVDNYAAMFKEL